MINSIAFYSTPRSSPDLLCTLKIFIGVITLREISVFSLYHCFFLEHSYQNLSIFRSNSKFSGEVRAGISCVIKTCWIFVMAKYLKQKIISSTVFSQLRNFWPQLYTYYQICESINLSLCRTFIYISLIGIHRTFYVFDYFSMPFALAVIFLFYLQPRPLGLS